MPTALHKTKRAARQWVWVGAIVLVLLHHDFWFWDSTRLVLGALPVGLAYQVGFSIAAVILWAAAIRWAWPSDLEAWADGEDNAGGADDSYRVDGARHIPADETEAQPR